MLTCKDLIEVLAEYLEGLVDAGAAAAVEKHLESCEPCVAYLNTYRRTRELGGAAARLEMPEEMKRCLRQFLIDRLSRAAR